MNDNSPNCSFMILKSRLSHFLDTNWLLKHFWNTKDCPKLRSKFCWRMIRWKIWSNLKKINLKLPWVQSAPSKCVIWKKLSFKTVHFQHEKQKCQYLIQILKLLYFAPSLCCYLQVFRVILMKRCFYFLFIYFYSYYRNSVKAYGTLFRVMTGAGHLI